MYVSALNNSFEANRQRIFTKLAATGFLAQAPSKNRMLLLPYTITHTGKAFAADQTSEQQQTYSKQQRMLLQLNKSLCSEV